MKVEFQKNVSDVEKEGHEGLTLDKMKLAASRAAEGRACWLSRFFCSRQRAASSARRLEIDSRIVFAEVASDPV